MIYSKSRMNEILTMRNVSSDFAAFVVHKELRNIHYIHWFDRTRKIIELVMLSGEIFFQSRKLTTMINSYMYKHTNIVKPTVEITRKHIRKLADKNSFLIAKVFKYIPYYWLTEELLIKLAVKFRKIIKYIPHDMKTRDLFIKMIRERPSIIKRIPKHIKDDNIIAQAIISEQNSIRCADVIEYIPRSRITQNLINMITKTEHRDKEDILHALNRKLWKSIL